MRNQYIAKVDQLDSLRMFKNAVIEVEEFEIGNDKVLFRITTKENSFKEANLLDKINTEINQNYEEVQLISCDSSEFYNQKLYKLVNKMERKIREFVYIAIIKVDTEEFENLYGQLEKIDFGELYKMLFTDDNFAKATKQVINQNKFNQLRLILDGSFSKDEILTTINQIEEHTIWDKINNGLSVPKLKKEFSKIKSYRNSVMHAHNISKEIYESANALFSEINKELDIEINKLLMKKEQLSIGSDLAESITSSLGSFKITYDENTKNVMNEYIKNSMNEIIKNVMIDLI